MLHFELYNGTQWIKYEPLMQPSVVPTFDETLDSATFILKAGSGDLITPDTRAKIYVDNILIANMIVATDSVQLFSRTPLTYQHTVQMVQNTHILQKYVVRNCSFSQPRSSSKRGWCVIPIWNGEYQALTSNTIREFKLLYNEKIALVNNQIPVKLTFKTCSTYDNSGDAPRSYSNLTDLQIIDSSNNHSPISSSDPVLFNFAVKLSDGTTTTITKTTTAGVVKVNSDDPLVLYLQNDVVSITSVKIIVSSGIDNNIYIADYDSFHIFFEVDGIYSYSMYDVIDLIRKQYELENDAYHTDANHPYKYQMPTGTLETVLKNTIAPNFTFTGATMYDCLAEIFKYYDAIFTLDENNKIGIEYLNKFSQQRIETVFTNMTTSFAEDKFTTGYISYFENALVTQTITMRPRNTQIGVSGEDSWYFIAPQNIQSIDKAEILVSAGYISGRHGTELWKNRNIKEQWLDITEYITSEEVRSLAPWNVSAELGIFANNTLGYQSNKIKISGSFEFIGDHYDYRGIIWTALAKVYFQPLCVLSSSTFVSQAHDFNYNYSYIQLRITYKARVDGRLRIENEKTKFNGEMIVNQANGAVDLNKLGLNILGLSLKLGEPVLNATQTITSWANAVKKGQILNYENESWVANVINYVFLANGKVQANIKFVKNYNALSSRVQIDRQKRMSLISNELTVKSEDNYKEYVYISSKNTQINNGQAIAIFDNNLKDAELMTFGITPSRIVPFEFIAITPWHFDETPIRANEGTSGQFIISNVYVPTVKYASGNAICFEGSLDDPISAGLQTKFEDVEGTALDNGGYTRYALYSDNGWADKLLVKFSTRGGSDFSDEFPYLQSSEIEDIGRIENLIYYKKPNEIFALNYEMIHLVPPDRINKDFIGNQFIKANGFLTDKPYKGTLKLYYSISNLYSPFDYKGIGNFVNITNISSSGTGSHSIAVHFTHTAIIMLGVISWAICDEKGNILFASNSSHSGTTLDLYITPTHYRL